MMSYISEIANILGVEPGQVFNVQDSNDNKSVGWYFFSPERGLCNAINNDISSNVLVKLLNGNYFINRTPIVDEKCKEFKPRIGERYWYIPLPCHTEESSIFGNAQSFERSLSKNFFRTREEARKGKKKIIKQYENFRRDCKQYIQNKEKMEAFFHE